MAHAQRSQDVIEMEIVAINGLATEKSYGYVVQWRVAGSLQVPIDDHDAFVIHLQD